MEYECNIHIWSGRSSKMRRRRSRKMKGGMEHKWIEQSWNKYGLWEDVANMDGIF